MSIVGFNFTKISAERKNSVVGTVNISNNISLKDLTEAKLGLASDRGAVRVTFVFKSDYMPDLATILFEGEVLMLFETKQHAALLDGWKNGKSITRDIAEPLMNYILDRCNVQALLMSKDLNLPSPVPLPKVQVNLPEVTKTEEAKPMKTTKVEAKKKK